MAALIEGFTNERILYVILLQDLIRSDDRPAPRGLPTRAIRNLTIVHEDPGDVLLTGISRGLSPKLLALEPLQLVGGFSDPQLLVQTVPHYANFMDNGGFWGAYGLRLSGKVGLVAERLKQDPASRQAHVSFWRDDMDLAFEGKHDYPCTISAHFEIDGAGRLNGTTVMRSNDAWLGYPYDVVQHSCLLKTLARFLHVPVGTYTHIVHNMHLYEKDLEAAEKLIERLMGYTENPPRMDGGIGTGDEEYWSDVQSRAVRMTYVPQNIEPATLEETFYINAMKGMTGDGAVRSAT
jgi:thymidylate synthase